MRPSVILAVDDNPINLSILQELLEESHELHVAGSGEEALKLAPDLRADLILLDIMMPGIDGYETCRRLREMPHLAYAKIIMVSAKSLVSERIAGYDAGADDYVTKPFDHDEFLAKVNVYMRLKRIEEVDKLKTSFLSLLSHGTRTPLNAIVAPCELLAAHGEMKLNERMEFAAMALEGARCLTRLLQNAALLTALRAGEVPINRCDTELADLVRSAITETAKRGRKVALQEAAGDVPVSVDREKVAYILRSLIDVAGMVATAGFQVTVSTDADETALVEVRARGTTIPSEELSLLFEPFADTTFERGSGTNLALAVASELAQGHGGSLEAVADGEETVLRMRLPRAQRTVSPV